MFGKEKRLLGMEVKLELLNQKIKELCPHKKIYVQHKDKKLILYRCLLCGEIMDKKPRKSKILN
jgi:hypothetical protein